SQLVITKDLREEYCFVTNSSPPCQLGHTALDRRKERGGARLSIKCKITHIVKHSLHTVNPLIAPHVNPFLPSAISTVSVLFFSTDHCIGVTGDVSDTKSVLPSVRMSTAVPL
ncbi:unnamed protein product, partial [Staurois parvus]